MLVLLKLTGKISFGLLNILVDLCISKPVFSDVEAHYSIQEESNDDGGALHGGEHDGDLPEDAEVGGVEVEGDEEDGLQGEHQGHGDVGQGQA